MSSTTNTAWKVMVAGAAVFWVTQGARWLRGMRQLPRLSPVPSHPASSDHHPHYIDAPLAIVVPASNEECALEPAIRSLLAHAPRGALVMAVDDRSTDGTSALLERLGRNDDRMRVIHIKNLPPGWLGKNHALMAGTEAARRLWGGSADLSESWYLFTDADVTYAEGGIEAALHHARRRGLDHLTLAPALDARGFWETTFTSAFMFLFGLAFRIWEVNNPKSTAFVGIGAFNLVRAGAYEAMGAHRALRMEVADDVKLGEAMRRSGARQEIALGHNLLSVRWQHGLWGLVTGLEKNAFAGIDYSVPRLLWTTVGITILNIPFVAVATERGVLRAASAAALCMIARIYAQAEETGGPPWAYWVTFPLGTGLFLVSLWRSAALALMRGGVMWRDTFYPLAELKGREMGRWIPTPDVVQE